MAAKKEAEQVNFEELEVIEMHREELTFELTDKDIPKTKRGPRSEGPNIYQQKLDEFLALDVPSKHLQFSGRKPMTIATGFRKAIDASGLKDKVTVISRNAGEDLWLARK